MSRLARSLQNIKSTSDIDLEVHSRIRYRRRHGHLRREVIYLGRVLHYFCDLRLFPHIPNSYLQPAASSCNLLQIFKVVTRARTRQVIEYMDLRLGCLQQSARPIR